MQPKRKLRYPMTRPRFDLGRLLAGGVSAVLVTALLGVPGPAAAAEPVELARDTFTRTTTSGLGTAEKGGDWIASNAYSVSGGAARVVTTPAQIQPAWLRTDSTDIDFVTTASFNRPDSGRLKVGVRGRMNGGATYDATVLVPASGALVLQLQRTGAVMATAQLSGLNFSSGDRIRIRMQTIGTYNAQLRAKVWETGTPEPSSWQVSAIDSTSSAPAASPVAFWAANDGTTSPASIAVSFDDVIMSTTGAPPPPPPNKAPRALFTIKQTGRTITVDASASTDSDGTIRSYEWDFGDGSKGTGKIATHTYAGEGQWGIKLTITDDDGAFGRASNGVRYFESALVGKTTVSLNKVLPEAPQDRQVYFGSGADVNYNFAPTLTRGIDLWVMTPGSDTSMGITVTPPTGHPLKPGHYRHLYLDTSGTVPRVTVSTGYAGDVFNGDLDIRELTADSTGKITSFDIVLGGSDLQWGSPLWGQIRANQPESPRYTVANRAHSFPSTPVGGQRIYATQWVRNTASTGVAVGRAALSAGSTADYTIADDRCSGTVLAPGAQCSLRVGFSPKAAGPRNATMSIPIDGSTQRIELNGWAPPGKSSITISSEVLAQPPGSTFANGKYLVWAARVFSNTSFAAAPRAEHADASVGIRHGRQQALTLGRHMVSDDPMDPDGHHLSVGAEGRGCNPLPGSSYTVHTYKQTSDGAPAMADISFTAYCLGSNGRASTGRVLYNLRSDTTAPSRPSSLKVSGSGSSRSVSWSRSGSSDLSYTVARLVPGTSTTANGTNGYAVYSGTGTSAGLPAMKKGQRYTLHVFSVDKTGNVSAPATIVVTG
jgi:PKD repeat protein